MQLFELVSPRLFRPLAGPNRAFYAELLLLLWEECRHTADYSILRAEAVSRAEDYFAALAKPLALDADDAGDEAEQPTRDPHTLALGFLLRLRRTGWLAEQPGSYEEEPALAFVPEVTPLLEALEEILNPRVVTYTGKLYKATWPRPGLTVVRVGTLDEPSAVRPTTNLWVASAPRWACVDPSLEPFDGPPVVAPQPKT